MHCCPFWRKDEEGQCVPLELNLTTGPVRAGPWLFRLEGVGAEGGPCGSWALVGAAQVCAPWLCCGHGWTEVDTGEKAPCAHEEYEASLQHWVLSWLCRQSTNETHYLT